MIVRGHDATVWLRPEEGQLASASNPGAPMSERPCRRAGFGVPDGGRGEIGRHPSTGATERRVFARRGLSSATLRTVSEKHRLDEVFGVARDLPVNYVVREAVDGTFVSSLARDKHIVVFGSSEAGQDLPPEEQPDRRRLHRCHLLEQVDGRNASTAPSSRPPATRSSRALRAPLTGPSRSMRSWRGASAFRSLRRPRPGATLGTRGRRARRRSPLRSSSIPVT